MPEHVLVLLVGKYATELVHYEPKRCTTREVIAYNDLLRTPCISMGNVVPTCYYSSRRLPIVLYLFHTNTNTNTRPHTNRHSVRDGAGVFPISLYLFGDAFPPPPGAHTA